MVDLEQIYKWWAIFQNNGGKLCEVRCLDGKKTYSGYYHNIENLIRDVTPLSDRPNMQIYFVLNTINKDCYDRQQQERMIENPKNTTTDADILGRNFILLDFDPKRPAGVGSTDDQFKESKIVAKSVYNFLLEQGFYEPIVCKSGNGTHLLIPVHLANTPENTKLVERFLKAIAMLFSNEKVDCDVKVGNASRICKLYGTYAKKGANTPEHPWRLAKVWKCPDVIQTNKREYIEKIANMYPDERPAPSRDNNFGQGKFDIIDFFNRHNIEYRAVQISGGTRYILKECPFDSGHKDPDSMVFQHDNGALAFMCYHNSCSNYTWRDFRLHYESDAYDNRSYEQFKYKQMQQMTKYQLRPPETQPLVETAEKGAIWLKMSQIKRPKFDLADYIPSGVEQIDKLMVGFKRKHVSVWSGYRGSAKTTILNMLILNAAQREYKTALWTGELDGDEEKKWLYLQAAGKTYNKMTTVKDFYYTPDNVCDKIDPWIDKYMWIFNNQYGNNFKQIVEKLRELKRNNDIDMAIFDNLMTLDIDDLDGDKNDRQKNLMQMLTELARELDIHIHIVAHPNKSGTFLRPNNISGSGHIPDLAQNVFILHRVNQDFCMNAKEFLPNSVIEEILNSHCTNCIEICKCRDKGSAVDHFIRLFFEMESNRLKNDVAENIIYNWCPDAPQIQMQSYTVPSPTQAIMPNMSFDEDPELPFDGDNSGVPF